MRCNPDGTDFEIFTTGVRNPQDLVFNERGDLFTGDNNSDAGDKVRFTYLVEGGDCGWRMAFQYLPDRGPWMREKPWDEAVAPSIRYIVPTIMNVGNGPSGLSYNPGTALSPKYYGNFYLSDFRGGAAASVVHEIHLEPKGAFYTGTHRDWVKGILTTDAQFGNDGALYVLDWVAELGRCGQGANLQIYRSRCREGPAKADREIDLRRHGETARRGIGEPPWPSRHARAPGRAIRVGQSWRRARQGARDRSGLHECQKPARPPPRDLGPGSARQGPGSIGFIARIAR